MSVRNDLRILIFEVGDKHESQMGTSKTCSHFLVGMQNGLDGSNDFLKVYAGMRGGEVGFSYKVFSYQTF